MGEDERLKRVADAVKVRRLALGLSQQKAADRGGLSGTTWRMLEAYANPVSELSKAGFARALDWPVDAIDRLIAGASADELETTSKPPPREQAPEGDQGHDVMDDVTINFNAPPDQVPPEALEAIKTLLRPYFEGER